MTARCVVCGRNPATRGVVCAGERKRILGQLAALPAQIDRLSAHLIPSTTPASEWVTVTSNGSRPPVRLDVLSLVGPGARPVPTVAALRPAVRQWSTSRTVTVRLTRAGGIVEEQDVTIPEWHREPVLGPDGQQIRVVDDDQVGALPPKEWLDAQVRAWRRAFAHHVPNRTMPGRPAPAEAMSSVGAAAERAQFVPWLAGVAVWNRPAAAAFGLLCAIRAVRDHKAATVLGMHPGHGGNRPVDDRVDDPVDELWHIRYGIPQEQAIRWDVAYLTTWMDHALERDLGIARFASELGAIHAEIRYVLGDHDQVEWLGRCPATIIDRETHTDQLCGAGLWLEAGSAQVQCRRCTSTWGPGYNELVLLAREVRRKHPIDRRRRYDSQDVTRVPRVTCPACSSVVKVQWQEVTADRDNHRYWSPQKVTCPSGCPEADRLR